MADAYWAMMVAKAALGDAPGEDCDEEQVEGDVEDRGNCQKYQRHGGVSQRPEHAGEEVVEGRCDESCEDDEQVLAHAVPDVCRYAEECEDRI